MDRDELDRLGLVKSAEEEAPPAEQEVAEERVSPGRAQHAPVPEGMQLIPAETLERLVNIAASYAEAGSGSGGRRRSGTCTGSVWTRPALRRSGSEPRWTSCEPGARTRPRRT